MESNQRSDRHISTPAILKELSTHPLPRISNRDIVVYKHVDVSHDDTVVPCGGPLEVGKDGVISSDSLVLSAPFSICLWRHFDPYFATMMGRGVSNNHIPDSSTKLQPAPRCRLRV